MPLHVRKRLSNGEKLKMLEDVDRRGLAQGNSLRRQGFPMELSLFLLSSLIISFFVRCVLTHFPSCGLSLYPHGTMLSQSTNLLMRQTNPIESNVFVSQGRNSTVLYMENVQAAAPDGSPVCTGSGRTVCRAFSLLLSSKLQRLYSIR